MKATAGKAVFEYEADGMAVSWVLLSKEDGTALIGKLDRMLAFLRREYLGDAAPAAGAAPSPAVASPARGLALPAAPPGPIVEFTGKPVIVPPSLEQSVAAMGPGWEMWRDDD
jgi:hypothetical protein